MNKTTIRDGLLPSTVMVVVVSALISAPSLGGAPTNDVSDASLSSCFADAVAENLCWRTLTSSPDAVRMHDFGVHYANGDGIRQDFEKGRYWIQHAALSGYPLAQYNLGIMYFDGIGGEQDRDCALYWLNLASKDHHGSGQLAKEALWAIAQFGKSTPKVYRMLTKKDCEKVPTVEGWSSAPFDVSSDLTSFKPRLVALRAVFTQGVSAVMAHIEPQNRVHETAGEISYDSSLSLGAALGSSEETMPDTPPVNIVNAQNLREYLGYRFVDIGMLLLGQTQETKAAKREAARSVRASARPPGSSPLVSDGSGYLLPGVVCHENALALYQCDWKEEEILLSFSSKAIRSPMGSLPVAPSVPITHHDEVLTTGHGSSDRVTLPNEPRRIVPQHTVDDDKQRGTPHSVRAMGDYQEETLSSNLGGDIRKAAKHHYTLQLSSASTQAPLLALAKKYRLSNYLVYEKHKDGQTWFVLVYGEYRGISQARQALQQLPVEFKKNTPWVRRISHVQSEI